eukprot:Phypoly_transcript_07170.p1 GENE.Phypoly_transcript_07170~~Phypoly_transcript_07170.p1  ORF type:complete len:517 (+),score=63.80 Phypoly_transcript_07170:107-1657(+)
MRHMGRGVLVLFLVFVSLFFCCAASTGIFIHITDIHLDPEYKVGGNTLERCINITSNENSTTAGKWGSYPCDTPLPTYESALAQYMNLTQGHPDFVFWTGDSVPHYLDYTSVERYTYEMVLEGCTNVVNQLKSAFQGIPVFPALGNHDNFLSDQLPPSPAAKPWLSEMADLWSGWLPEDALATVRYGGYYSTLIKPGFRVLSFNSIYCDKVNLYAVLNQTDHADQFMWMDSVLASARAQGEKVYVIGHIVPTDYFRKCTDWYYRLAVEYSDVIVGHFFGDRHTDEFRVIYNDTTQASNPVGILYVNPSLVSFSDVNPTLRMFSYDNVTLDILDVHTYFVPLNIEANNDTLVWQFSYSASTEYSLPNMAPDSWAKLYQQMLQNAELRQKYVSNYKNKAAFPCDAKCQNNVLAETVWTAENSTGVQGKGLGESALCTLCKGTMALVDILLKINQTDEFIMDQLTTKICPIQPVFPPHVCRDFVGLYGPYALPVIGTLETAETVCYAMELCSNSSAVLY